MFEVDKCVTIKNSFNEVIWPLIRLLYTLKKEKQ